MVSFTLTYDKDILAAIADNIARAPQTIAVFAEKSLPKLIEKDLIPLRTEPRQPSLPFIWSYDPVKQRKAARYYFKNKVRGRVGGRHVRTHELVRNWKVVAGRLRNGAVMTVSNNTPGLDYVQGPKQVPSHADSGWAQYDEVLLRAERHANDIMIDAWLGILDTKGSVFK